MAIRVPWLGQAVVSVVVVGLAVAAVAWMATASPGGEDGIGPGSPPARAAAAVAPNAPASSYLLVVVSSDGAVAELRGMLLAESRLRALAGEAPRPAGVAVAHDDAEFLALTHPTNDEGAFSTQLAMHVVDLRGATR